VTPVYSIAFRLVRVISNGHDSVSVIYQVTQYGSIIVNGVVDY